MASLLPRRTSPAARSSTGVLDSCNIPYVKRFPHYGGFGNLMMGMSAEGVDIFVPETMLEEAKNILEGESENEEL